MTRTRYQRFRCWEIRHLDCYVLSGGVLTIVFLLGAILTRQVPLLCVGFGAAACFTRAMFSGVRFEQACSKLAKEVQQVSAELADSAVTAQVLGRAQVTSLIFGDDQITMNVRLTQPTFTRYDGGNSVVGRGTWPDFDMPCKIPADDHEVLDWARRVLASQVVMDMEMALSLTESDGRMRVTDTQLSEWFETTVRIA